MKEFLTQNYAAIFAAVVVVIFVFRAARVLNKAKKIDREGVETDAVISRIVENWNPDTASSSYTTYAEYRDESGELRESPMALSSNLTYAKGEKLRIRYIPGDHELVRAVK